MGRFQSNRDFTSESRSAGLNEVNNRPSTMTVGVPEPPIELARSMSRLIRSGVGPFTQAENALDRKRQPHGPAHRTKATSWMPELRTGGRASSVPLPAHAHTPRLLRTPWLADESSRWEGGGSHAGSSSGISDPAEPSPAPSSRTPGIGIDEFNHHYLAAVRADVHPARNKGAPVRPWQAKCTAGDLLSRDIGDHAEHRYHQQRINSPADPPSRHD